MENRVSTDIHPRMEVLVFRLQVKQTSGLQKSFPDRQATRSPNIQNNYQQSNNVRKSISHMYSFTTTKVKKINPYVL